MKKNIKIAFRLILIILGVFALGFQTFYFIFSSLNRTSNDVRSRIFTDTVPHFFTLIICVWFIVFQIKALINKKPNQKSK